MRTGVPALATNVLVGLLITLVVYSATAQVPKEAHPTSAPAANDGKLLLLIAPRHPETLNAVDFAAIPHKTVTYHNAHTKADELYAGVPLTDLLAKYGAPAGDQLRGKPLSEYIVATGADGYKAVLSLAETDPAFHAGDVIVADTMDGKPIGDNDGPFRLIVTEDKRPARCVRNPVSIELRAAD